MKKCNIRKKNRIICFRFSYKNAFYVGKNMFANKKLFFMNLMIFYYKKNKMFDT